MVKNIIDEVNVFMWQASEELWVETAQKLTDEVQLIIEFAKFVPGFINLPQDDQIMLLKGGGYSSVESIVYVCCF